MSFVDGYPFPNFAPSAHFAVNSRLLRRDESRSYFVLFVVKHSYSSTTEISDSTPLRFNSSKNIG